MEQTPEAGVGRRRLEEELRRREAELEVQEREAAGELADTDQHQGDIGTETMDRERALGRVEDLRARLDPAYAGDSGPGRMTRPGVVTPGPDPDDDRTPLDEPAERPADLASLPAPDGAAEGGTTQDLDAPGELYAEGRTVPRVGEPEPDDDAIEGSYRPD
jgi:hypothetical protein